MLAVDFGSSNTAAAFRDSRGNVHQISLSHDGWLMPSAVLYTAERTLVGRTAVQAALTDPDAFEPSPKRRIDVQQIYLGQYVVAVTDLVAAVLREVFAKAQRNTGVAPDRVVLTHPDKWTVPMQELLREAAIKAGVAGTQIRLISEASAAAWYFTVTQRSLPVGARLAVFDFGAGTCDVAVLDKQPDGTFSVIASDGVEGLGGYDLDARIAAWVRRQLAEADPVLADELAQPGAIGARLTLNDRIREAKEALSEASHATIAVANGTRTQLLMLTRDEFNQLISSDLDRTVELTTTVLAAAQRTRAVDSPPAIYFTGGSSAIPAVHTRLQALGKLGILGDPKTVLSQGALHATATKWGLEGQTSPVRGPDLSGRPPALPQPPTPTPYGAERTAIPSASFDDEYSQSDAYSIDADRDGAVDTVFVDDADYGDYGGCDGYDSDADYDEDVELRDQDDYPQPRAGSPQYPRGAYPQPPGSAYNAQPPGYGGGYGSSPQSDYDRPGYGVDVPTPAPPPPARMTPPSAPNPTVSQWVPPPPPATYISSTVFAPATAPPGRQFLAQVFVHLPEQAADVERIATQRDQSASVLGDTDLYSPVHQGESLTFELSIPGLMVDRSIASLVWLGRPRAVQFGVFVPPNHPPYTVIGTVTISRGSVPMGHIKFALNISAPDATDPGPRRAPSPGYHQYRRAFISYASPDRKEVLKRTQMLAATGIEFFQDLLTLKPGQLWEGQLYHEIDQCDLFLLFWSTAARNSPWVWKEVQHALNRSRGNHMAPPEILPVIIEGPPAVPPPPELQHLHFNDRMLYFMQPQTHSRRTWRWTRR